MRQIQCRARTLGVSRSYWTDEELSLLREYYPKLGTKIPQLSHKSAAAITSCAERLGLVSGRAWSAVEDSLIISKYPSCGSNIPELIGRTEKAIGLRALKLGVRYSKDAKWIACLLVLLIRALRRPQSMERADGTVITHSVFLTLYCQRG